MRLKSFVVMFASVLLGQCVAERVEESVASSSEVMPADGLVQRNVVLHSVGLETGEVVLGQIGDGQSIIVTIGVDILTIEVGVIEVTHSLDVGIVIYAALAGHVLIQREGCGTLASRIRGLSLLTIDNEVMTLGTIELAYTEPRAGVSTEARECP